MRFSATSLAVIALLAASRSVHAAIFDTATITGGLTNSATIGAGGTPLEDVANLPISGGFGGITLSTGANVALPDGSISTASSSLNATFTLLTISANGLASVDCDNLGDAVSGIASAASTLSIVFTIPIDEAYFWSFTDGTAGGTHASASVSLSIGDTVLFSSATDDDNDFTNNTGFLFAGTYTLAAEATAFSNLNDGFNGLFADSNFSFDFALNIPEPTSLIGLAFAATGALLRRSR